MILLVVIIFGVGFLFLSRQGQKERLDVAQEEDIEEEDFGNTADLPDVRETEELEQERYFIGRNLERYLAYMKNNPELSMSEVVRNVNSNLDRTRYVDVKDADLSYGVLAMVNKFNYLGGYEPDDLVRLGEGYSNGTAPMLRREVAEAFVKMADAARSEGLVLMNISGYRSYTDRHPLSQRGGLRWLTGIPRADRLWEERSFVRGGGHLHSGAYKFI